MINFHIYKYLQLQKTLQTFELERVSTSHFRISIAAEYLHRAPSLQQWKHRPPRAKQLGPSQFFAYCLRVAEIRLYPMNNIHRIKF